ncbi:hypothetical protein Q8A73_013506 [Channa argus]|nr:hypothetical protein Q8A73_013506 [Channa argus]
MAAIPAGGSLVATTDYYRRRIGSTSSSSSCGSSEYSGEVIPHHPGLPKQDSGHWWSSFFFGKQPGMTPLTEEAQQKAGVPGAVINGQITCVAREMVMQRQWGKSIRNVNRLVVNLGRLFSIRSLTNRHPARLASRLLGNCRGTASRGYARSARTSYQGLTS